MTERRWLRLSVLLAVQIDDSLDIVLVLTNEDLISVVDDLDATEARILAAGIETFSHADYEPGRRFYFNDADGIEFEVVSYN